MESHHPGRPCGPCFLCGKRQERYCHLNGLEEQHQEFFHRYLTIPGDSCMCRAHRMEAVRHVNDVHYIPKWNKRSVNNSEIADILECTYPECHAKSDRERVVMPLEKMKALFIIKLSCIHPSHVQALCDKHYQKLYRPKRDIRSGTHRLKKSFRC